MSLPLHITVILPFHFSDYNSIYSDFLSPTGKKAPSIKKQRREMQRAMRKTNNEHRAILRDLGMIKGRRIAFQDDVDDDMSNDYELADFLLQDPDDIPATLNLWSARRIGTLTYRYHSPSINDYLVATVPLLVTNTEGERLELQCARHRQCAMDFEDGEAFRARVNRWRDPFNQWQWSPWWAGAFYWSFSARRYLRLGSRFSVSRCGQRDIPGQALGN